MTSRATTYQICAQDRAGCNAGNRELPTNAPDLGAHSKAPNGFLYLPAPMVTSLDDGSLAAEARGPILKETDSPSGNLLKRGLTNPKDDGSNGTMHVLLCKV